MLELDADITDEWMLDLWEALPTPAKAARVRESTVKKILKDHRIRRIDAAQTLAILRKPAVGVAPGTTEAATAHIRTLIARLRLVIEQLKGAHRQLEILCARLAEPVGKTDLSSQAQERRLSLGECRHPVRRQESGEIRCSEGARS